jgi:hypothetical protein
VNTADSNPPATFFESQERNIVWLLCLLGAVHIFVFSAAAPFFSNVDEQIHLDLAIKYAQGHVPRSLEPVSAELVPYVVLYGSPEYAGLATNYPGGQFPPPPWTQPIEKFRPALTAKMEMWRSVTNYEAAQPPLYYSVAALWWHLGKICGFHDAPLLYWLRFLNLVFIMALVWLGHAAARLIFPDRIFVRLGVPALLAFLPQSAFYSIQNDVLSPLTFGAAFILLVPWLRAETPGVRPGALAGLALAATFLTKISNLPFLAVSGLAVLLKFHRLTRSGKLRAAGPSLVALALCAGLPIMAWLAWCRHAFGDFTGTAAKIQFLNWTTKPFGDWWLHPIFTPYGLWTFASGLMGTFWQGEYLWHRQPLASPRVDAIYTLASAGLITAAVVPLLARSPAATAAQRQALWFGFGNLLAAVVFLGFLSIIYDFRDCFYPSRAHPYFTSGRLMLGALIPFLLLYLYGLDRVLSRFGNRAKFLVLAAMILFLLIAESSINRPLFSNSYNWFHL